MPIYLIDLLSIAKRNKIYIHFAKRYGDFIIQRKHLKEAKRETDEMLPQFMETKHKYV